MRRDPSGLQGHKNKQAISAKRMQHGVHTYNEPLTDEHSNTDA